MPSASLQGFLRKQFPLGVKARHVSHALAALHEEKCIKLSPEQSIWVGDIWPRGQNNRASR
jgi:hypothetical protein